MIPSWGHEDSGDGYEFERGQFGRTRVTCHVEDSIQLYFGIQEGLFDPPGRKTVEFDLRGTEWPTQMLVGGVATDTWEHADGRLLLRLPWSSAVRTVRISAAVM